MNRTNDNRPNLDQNIELSVEINFGRTSHKATTCYFNKKGVAVISDKAIFRDVGSNCQMSGYHKNKPFHLDCQVARVYANKMALTFLNSRENQCILNRLLAI